MNDPFDPDETFTIQAPSDKEAAERLATLQQTKYRMPLRERLWLTAIGFLAAYAWWYILFG